MPNKKQQPQCFSAMPNVFANVSGSKNPLSQSIAKYLLMIFHKSTDKYNHHYAAVIFEWS